MRRRKTLLWSFYPWYLLIILFSLVLISYYTTRWIRIIYLERTAEDLRARSLLISRMIEPCMVREETETVRALCNELGARLGTRITVILPTGRVVADSEARPDTMDNHASRPEIRQALQDSTGLSSRYSRTLQMDMMYVAEPVIVSGRTRAVVRTAVPVTALSETLTAIYRRIALAGFIIILVAGIISLALSQRIRRPVDALRRGAGFFGTGELDYRIRVDSPEEFHILSEAMNRMAGQLSERMHTIIRQRNELEGVLSSMIEGVLVIDTEEKIVRFNRAAGSLFNIQPAAAHGCRIQEVIRNMDLLRFIRNTLDAGHAAEKQILLYNDRFLQAHGTVLLNDEGESVGVLVVLNDITHLKRLENIRKDFVANVSHELKTPITAIKGSVETLRDGAVSDTASARRFLDIIMKHADRLNATIEDLLDLSRIEQEYEAGQIVLKDHPVRSVMEEAVTVLENKITERSIDISIDCDARLQTPMNAHLIEEALVNLIENAVKYSPEGSRVIIRGYRKERHVVLEVEDKGPGIPAEHQERIFERFYRIDKARSRQLGGTGLGLAIVKHIVQAHHGSVSVHSRPGEGALFRLSLPSG